jgi:alanyl-tRNA synthetase
MNTAEVREKFVEYYKGLGYQSLPSAPMIDPSIPMSFVMSAGLVQVENSISKSVNRVGNQFVLVQDCFRHFDLEKVGTDDIHLSLFEMPGAFVFGPNGKNGTVQRMWELATHILGIAKDRIWVTYFAGGQIKNNFLPEDSITRQAWTDLGISENHILGLGTESNYWVQGKGIEDTSSSKKCGPNTELFFDRGEDMTCSEHCMPGCKCGRFVEFSNSLFISSEILAENDQIQPLINPFTETVIGAERVSMIHEKTRSVFDIKEFRPILNTVRQLARVNDLPEAWILPSERVIADHLRGLLYLVASGAPPPGKNGRERIVKMLVRRVITRLIILDINVPKHIPVLVGAIADSIFNIEHKDLVSLLLIGYFLSEYEKFMATVQRGKRQLMKFLEESNGNLPTSEQILHLEKKWGLPSLLTELIMQKKASGLLH